MAFISKNKMKKLRKRVSEDACLVELHNRRVFVQRLPKEKSIDGAEMIGLCFVKLCSTVEETDDIFFQHLKRGRNIVELSMTLSPNAAFALQEALASVIRLSDIPSECLVLTDPIDAKVQKDVVE